MNALKIALIAVASLLLVGCAGYLYASSGIKSKPGYAELVSPKGDSTTALLSVNVGSRGVKPARWLLEQIADDSDHAQDVPEQLLKGVLQDLQGVQLRVYDTTNNRQAFDLAIAQTVESLKQKQWQTLARVREDDVKIVVLQYGTDVTIAGLSIMASTPDKAMFLNLIGPFDTQELVETATNIN